MNNTLHSWRSKRPPARFRDSLVVSVLILDCEGEAIDAPPRPKLEKVDEIAPGALFGGGGATLAQVSADGRWIVVADDR